MALSSRRQAFLAVLVMLSEYAASLYARIQRKNKKGIVTIDDLIQHTEYKDTDRIIEAIKELRSAGLLTTKSITNHGRFENELIPRDGYVEHKPQQHKVEKPKVIIKRKA